jgi:hypothetical protein
MSAASGLQPAKLCVQEQHKHHERLYHYGGQTRGSGRISGLTAPPTSPSQTLDHRGLLLHLALERTVSTLVSDEYSLDIAHLHTSVRF